MVCSRVRRGKSELFHRSWTGSGSYRMDVHFFSFLLNGGLDVAVAVEQIDAVLSEMFHFQDLVVVIILGMMKHFAQLVFFDLEGKTAMKIKNAKYL